MSEMYLSKLVDVLDHANKVKDKHMREEMEMAEEFPKNHMFIKVQRILKEKEGQSDFEIHIGMSELLMDDACIHVTKPLKNYYVPRKYCWDEL